MPLYDLELQWEYDFFDQNDMKVTHEDKLVGEFFFKKIQLPCTLHFLIQGKQEKNTIIDEQENILQDDIIKIKQVKLNNLIMPELCLLKWPLLFVNSLDNRSNYVEYSNTFGKNGCIELRFYGNDLFEWMFHCNKYKRQGWHHNL